MGLPKYTYLKNNYWVDITPPWFPLIIGFCKCCNFESWKNNGTMNYFVITLTGFNDIRQSKRNQTKDDNNNDSVKDIIEEKNKYEEDEEESERQDECS